MNTPLHLHPVNLAINPRPCAVPVTPSLVSRSTRNNYHQTHKAPPNILPYRLRLTSMTF